MKIAHWCIFDADNPSRIPFVVGPDLPNIRQTAEKFHIVELSFQMLASSLIL
jgi:hypothetical protein